jgi:integrase
MNEPKVPRRTPRGLYRRGTIWWCKYYVAGRPVRESTGTDDQRQAQRFLDARRGKVATGELVLPRADRVRYDEAAGDLRQHYATTGSRGKKEAEWRLTHLDRFFRGYPLQAIGPEAITRYVAKRQAEATQMIAAREGDTVTRRLTSNGTINRELGVLGRMLRLAYENGKLVRMPIIRKLKEAAPRQGFFERHQYEAVRRHLPAELQAAAAIAYTYGWRNRSEVLSLERRHLDLGAGTLRLDPGMTKNGEGRVVYLTAELRTVLGAQLERVDTLQKKLGRVIPYLFPHLSGRYKGQRRREYRTAWRHACAAAGVPGMLRHDFRRTAVRNMERSSVPRSVATKITGHKTEAVYRRYAIVSDADLRDATLRIEQGHARRQVQHGHNSGTIARAAVDGSAVSR